MFLDIEFPEVEVINDIATELGVAAAFIEKDWYSCQVLRALTSIDYQPITAIFSGGTSLSKAHGIIQRFSEDLDFRCRYETAVSGNQQKKHRSEFRKLVVECIRNLDIVWIDEPMPDPNGISFKFNLLYDARVKQHSSLRPHLELEFSFTQTQLVPVSKTIQSFVGQYGGSEPDCRVFCLPPLEIAADKLSALCWRVLKRDRAYEKDDPTLVRHLHDLSALDSVILGELENFSVLAEKSFAIDQQTENRNTGAQFLESNRKMVYVLSIDQIYRQEYSQFVDSMSYARDDALLTFDRALARLNLLVDLLGKQ